MICNLENIKDIISQEKLEICIISYGGCCSNALNLVLEQNGYITRSNTYNNLLCHYNIVIFIY